MMKFFQKTSCFLLYVLMLLISVNSFAQKALPVADPITVKVAVVIQDPRIPSMGNKRMAVVITLKSSLSRLPGMLALCPQSDLGNARDARLVQGDPTGLLI